MSSEFYIYMYLYMYFGGLSGNIHTHTVYKYVHVHDLIIHEMLRKKAKQHNTTERQSNTTQLTQGSIIQRKNCLG